MILRKNNNVKMNLVLSFDERKRIADVFVLLITIDKRDAKKAAPKKKKKSKDEYKEKGSQICGPFLFCSVYARLS